MVEEYERSSVTCLLLAQMLPRLPQVPTPFRLVVPSRKSFTVGPLQLTNFIDQQNKFYDIREVLTQWALDCTDMKA